VYEDIIVRVVAELFSLSESFVARRWRPVGTWHDRYLQTVGIGSLSKLLRYVVDSGLEDCVRLRFAPAYHAIVFAGRARGVVPEFEGQ
jgi:hypothetical protein